MARNLLALDPLDYELERQRGTLPSTEPAARQRDQGPDYDALSAKYRVPANVVRALTEEAGLANPEQVPAFAEQAAQRIGAEIQAGKDVPGALRSLLGEDAPVKPLLQKATALARPEDVAETQRRQEEARAQAEADRRPNALVSGAAGSIGAAAQAVGLDEMADRFEEYAAERAPRVGSYKDVLEAEGFGETASSAAKYAGGAILQSAPEMGVVAGAAAATLLTGGGALLAGGAALATSTLFNAGRAAQRQEEETDDINYAKAWAAGVAMGSLDAIVPGAVGKTLGRAFSRRAAGAAADVAARRGIGKAALKAASAEAATEFGQFLIEIGQADPELLRVMVNPTEDELAKSDQLVTEAIDSILGGGIAGGAFGGAGAFLERVGGGRASEEEEREPAPPGAPPREAPVHSPPRPTSDGPIGQAVQRGDPEGYQRQQQEAQEAERQAQRRRFPDLSEGDQVTLTDSQGAQFPATFLFEDGGEAVFDVEGREVRLPPEAARRALGQVADAPAAPETPAAEVSAAEAPAEPDPAEGIAPPAEQDPFTPGESGIQTPTAPPPPSVDLPPGIDPDEFEERAAIVQEATGLSREEAERETLRILQRREQQARQEAIPDATDQAAAGTVWPSQEEQDFDAAVPERPTAPSAAPAPDAPAPSLQEKWWQSLPKIRHAAKQLGLSKDALSDQWGDKSALTAVVNEELGRRGFADMAGPGAPDLPQTPPVDVPQRPQGPNRQSPPLPDIDAPTRPRDPRRRNLPDVTPPARPEPGASDVPAPDPAQPIIDEQERVNQNRDALEGMLDADQEAGAGQDQPSFSIYATKKQADEVAAVFPGMIERGEVSARPGSVSVRDPDALAQAIEETYSPDGGIDTTAAMRRSMMGLARRLRGSAVRGQPPARPPEAGDAAPSEPSAPVAEAISEANARLPEGFEIRDEGDGVALYEGDDRTSIAGLNRTRAGVEEAERQARRRAGRDQAAAPAEDAGEAAPAAPDAPAQPATPSDTQGNENLDALGQMLRGPAGDFETSAVMGHTVTRYPRDMRMQIADEEGRIYYDGPYIGPVEIEQKIAEAKAPENAARRAKPRDAAEAGPTPAAPDGATYTFEIASGHLNEMEGRDLSYGQFVPGAGKGKSRLRATRQQIDEIRSDAEFYARGDNFDTDDPLEKGRLVRKARAAKAQIDEVIGQIERGEIQPDGAPEPAPAAPAPTGETGATPEAAPEPDAEQRPAYGADNKLVTADRAAELRARLKDKLRNQTSAGIDPEIIAIGTELAVFHIEAGARRFADMARAIATDLDTTPDALRPYLRSWYNGARDMMEDNGIDIAGMDDADAVRATLQSGDFAAPEATDQGAAAEAESQRMRLAVAFAASFRDGRQFQNIVQARRFARQELGENVSAKNLEEAIEAGLVMRAREIVAAAPAPADAYSDLVALYGAQPNLAERTSTSVEQQAYSTPAPLAFLASRLAEIDPSTTVYEPSAGHGMLLIEADPAKVTATELNPDRKEALDAIYEDAEITLGDATEATPGGPFDRIITNPPFGKVKDGDSPVRNKRWPLGDRGNTTEIDHAIAMRALSNMKPDGRAVLIIGGQRGDADARRKAYQGRNHHSFVTKLYDGFNVTEHFTVAGDLYKKQGAGWPVDVIVIDGKGRSAKPYPYVEAPPAYASWSQLGRRLEDDASLLDTRDQRDGAGAGKDASPAEGAADQGALRDPARGADRGDGQEGRPGDARGNDADGVGQRGPGLGPAGADPETSGVELSGPAPSERPSDRAVAGAGGANEGDARLGAGDGASGSSSGDLRGGVSANRRENSEVETAHQVRYEPHSGAAYAVGTLVPRNMQSAIDRALASLKQRVGDIDQFVADKLGYTRDEVTGTDDKPGYFSAEQVDALAMAIENVENGAGFILGDQTGVGKGRVVAGMLRYAKRQGKTPVFVTKAPGLFGDMVRDLRDIGEEAVESRILPTNTLRGAKGAIPLSADPKDVLQSPSDAEHKNALAHVIRNGSLPDGYDMLFTTYYQLQYKGGSNGVKQNRQKAVDALAGNMMLVMDESHEAGGSETRQVDPETGEVKPTRADYFRELVKAADGVVYSSATYAKNPVVMSLYSQTDLKYAVQDIDGLADLVKAGGVPLQQIIANMLVDSSQYARRERSYDGVSIKAEEVAADVETAETVSRLLATTFNLDRDYMEGLRERYQEDLLTQGLAGAADSSVGEEAAHNVGFANVMHNLINQALFALKADAVADQAIALHREGKKPLIAVTNTNETILRDYIDDKGLSEGDPIDIQFNEIARRYLDRLRRVTMKDADKSKVHYWMSDEDIARLGGPEALEAVKQAEKAIADADLSQLSAMPLDRVQDRMREAGMKVGEITGRSVTVKGGKVTSREASDAAKKRTMNDFNSGALDAVLLNQSGSTGYSLHATGQPGNDGKKRHMLILQPDPNIDTFVQMLGRIHRTGQIKTPDYSIVSTSLAIERRVVANLMKKAASLNANTTASSKSAFSVENAADFLNKYGDQVVNEILRDDAELAARINVFPKGKGNMAGIASKVTGRLALLAPAEVDALYERISTAYRDYVDALDRMGMNTLEAKTLDLQAQTLDRSVLQEASGDGTSPFMREAHLETASVRRLGRAMTMEEIEAEVGDRTEGDPAAHVRAVQERLDELLPGYLEKMRESLEKAQSRLAAAKTDKQKEREQQAVANWQAKIESASSRVSEVKEALRELTPGRDMAVTIVDEETRQEATHEAVPLEIDAKGLKDNPTALSAIRVRFAIADPSREVIVPLSKLLGDDSPFSYRGSLKARVRHAFEFGQNESRETRQIITGNIVSGYSALGAKGQVVMFTRDDGSTEPGVLLPRGFDAEAEMAKQPVRFAEPDQVVRFLDGGANRLVSDSDGIIGISRTDQGGYALRVQSRGGKQFYLNRAVREIVGDFSGRGSSPKTAAARSGADLARILKIYSDNLGTTWETTGHKDEARAITGEQVFGQRGSDNAGDREMRADPDPTRADLKAVADDLAGEMRAQGLDRVPLKVVRELHSRATGQPIAGRFTASGGVEVAAGGGARGVLRHEVVHALRSEEMWGKPYGLFTQDEWRGLVRAAQAEPAIMRSVQERYSDLPQTARTEEAVAELYRTAMARIDAETTAGRALRKLRAFLQAASNAFRGRGFQSAALTMQRMAAGEIGGRGPDGPGGGAREGVVDSEMRLPSFKTGTEADPASPKGIPTGWGGPKEWRKKGADLWQDMLTDAMGATWGKSMNVLSLVPGRPLIEELAAGLPGAQRYLGFKVEMDALRQQWHQITDEVAQRWVRLGWKNPKANRALMDLMHQTTLAGIDPAQDPDLEGLDDQQAADKRESWQRFKGKYDALPKPFQSMYREVRDTYAKMADDFDQAIIDNLRVANEIAVKRAERTYSREMQRAKEDYDYEAQEAEEAYRRQLDRIAEGTGNDKQKAEGRKAAKVRRDRTLDGLRRVRQKAEEASQEKRDRVRASAQRMTQARMLEFRREFESNRMSGPYFPLARFGNYFVVARNSKGQVVSFSRAERQADQKQIARELEADGYTVETGVLAQEGTDLVRHVDPGFVSKVQSLLGDWDADPALMDTIWQRWLETLPDASLRKNRIHRKGRRGFNNDALRAFTHHVFHGSHQLARLKYGLQLEDAIEDAYVDAEHVEDNNRATLVVDEMVRRHQVVMNPDVAPWTTWASSLAFVWYLGVTPAAALVNISQTTVVGIPLMKAAFGDRTTTGKIMAELGRAGKSFVQGQATSLDGGTLEGRGLTSDEQAAMREAHRRGTVDRTQGHDLAAVQETGVEYAPYRTMAMKGISFFFHRAEVANREATFLASYRIARDAGMPHDSAIDKASALTWKVHFDYQNNARARFMQGNWPRVFLIFRQFTVNMLYRLFRDTHQALNGKTAEARREAKTQLAGMTLSMAAHAGITGVWGYGLFTALAAMFFPDMEGDDIDEWLHDALIWEGQGAGPAAWNYMAGMALKGVPGQVTGISLTERIGMPNLWFRDPYFNNMDTAGSLQYYIQEMLGPVPSIAFGIGRGIDTASQGEVWRGAEQALPKAVNDVMQSGRFLVEGVTTSRGDLVVDDVSPYEALVQAIGFTPARIAERYENNRRMRNLEREILDRRSRLQGEIADRLIDGKEITPAMMRKVREFNREYPMAAITRDTVRRSVSARNRYTQGVEGGVNVDQRIRPQIEERMAPDLYG